MSPGGDEDVAGNDDHLFLTSRFLGSLLLLGPD